MAIKSSSSRSSHNSHNRIRLWRRPSPSSISPYVFLLLVLSVLFFFFPWQIPQDGGGGGNGNDISFVDERPRDMPHINEDFSQVSEAQLWNADFNYGFSPCAEPTKTYKAAQKRDRYLTVRSNGGLNQMRTGISDMVAIARILDATLVIPVLDKKSFWQDSSTFSDIFDESHFITSLQGDVTIIKELPKELESVPRIRKHLASWGSMGYYEELTRELGKVTSQKLVERLRLHGRYIALHLRYEKDMLSFTGCTYGLSQAEAEELRIMRENTNHWKMKKINSTEQRLGGYCPLTPKEVGIFLQALGYPPSTWIYIAAGEIYGGDQRLSDLRSHFPNLVSKEMVANPEELKMFANHASQTAALDYVVSVESDVFIPSYSGNMARAVEGHRRFLGHRKTITPDRQGLVELFDKLERGDLKEGSSLSSLVTKMHEHRQGAPRKRFGSLPGIKGRARFRSEESFYENPFPECICRTKMHDQSHHRQVGKKDSSKTWASSGW